MQTQGDARARFVGLAGTEKRGVDSPAGWLVEGPCGGGPTCMLLSYQYRHPQSAWAAVTK